MTFFSKNTSIVVKRLVCYIASNIGLPHRRLLSDCDVRGGGGQNSQKNGYVVSGCPLSRYNMGDFHVNYDLLFISKHDRYRSYTSVFLKTFFVYITILPKFR